MNLSNIMEHKWEKWSIIGKFLSIAQKHNRMFEKHNMPTTGVLSTPVLTVSYYSK